MHFAGKESFYAYPELIAPKKDAPWTVWGKPRLDMMDKQNIEAQMMAPTMIMLHPALGWSTNGGSARMAELSRAGR